MKYTAEDYIKLIEQKRFDKISRSALIIIAKKFRELNQKNLLNVEDYKFKYPTVNKKK